MQNTVMTKVNGGGSDDDIVKDTIRATGSSPLYRIIKYFERSIIGRPNEALTVSVMQRGKDAAWAEELATRYEFSKYADWTCKKTVIIQIGMTE